MNKETAVKIFESKQVRTRWDEEQEKWYFSIIDVLPYLPKVLTPMHIGAS